MAISVAGGIEKSKKTGFDTVAAIVRDYIHFSFYLLSFGGMDCVLSKDEGGEVRSQENFKKRLRPSIEESVVIWSDRK